MKNGNHHNPFGVLAFLHWNHDWNEFHFTEELVRKAAQQLEDLGVGMVRLDILWSDVHSGDDKYDFARYDRILKILGEYKFQILALLHYNKIHMDGPDKIKWNLPPDSFEEFSRYVNATITRYKNQIHHWEIWNEPNHPEYWAAPMDGLKKYTDLLRHSYQAAKKADPNCIVLNGGITEPLIKDVTNFYENGGKDLCDIFAIHTFLDPFLPGVEKEFDRIITDVHNIMIKHKDGDKKIWITEMGCPGIADPATVNNWWAGKNLNELEQAEWLEKQYAMIKKYPYIEKLFWAFYRDTKGIFKSGADYLGLVRFDFSPKPAYKRMKQLIKG